MRELNEASEHGLLTRPDGTQMYWEASGTTSGAYALYLHGGPGSGLGESTYRRRFNPDTYRVIAVDQRGCGRSTPLACDDVASLNANTTQAIIADLEALREHLQIETWLIHGVSWGCTLALAYALEYPERVTGLVLTAVTTGSREEIDWITEGVGALFPEAHAKFRRPVADGERLVSTYARLLREPETQTWAAQAWNEWESTHVSLDPGWTPDQRFTASRDGLNFALLVTHYWANDCFLAGEKRIFGRVEQLNGIPAVLIHGRRDFSSPAITPWRLHHSWPTSELIIVEEEGHGGVREMELTVDAIARLAPEG